MQRIWRQAALVGAVAMGSVAGRTAQAQINIDFRTTNGGFTQQTLTAPTTNNPWTWQSGQGWLVNGVGNGPSAQRLLSPVLTATGGTFSVDARHFFDFEQAGPTSCFDGGNVKVSINGGAFQVLAPTAGRGYTGPISTNFGNPLGGQNAFCGQSGGVVSSVFSASLAAGTQVRLALDAGWDDSFQTPNPNWRLESVSIQLGTVTPPPPPNVVPEPSTYALLGMGLGGVGFIARRRRSTKA